MNFDEVLARVNQLLKKNDINPLDPAQKAILQGSWTGDSYKRIAAKAIYSEGYIRTLASDLWKLLSEILGEQITKKNFRLIIENIDEKEDENTSIRRLIEEVCENIQNYNQIENYQGSILNTHALIKAESKEYIRESQTAIILTPVKEKLELLLGNKANIETHLRQLISYLQDNFPHYQGYAAGNIINLLICLEINLSGYNFSNLTIWQAYLSQVNLHKVNFSNCSFKDCVFTDVLDGVFSVAFSKDGKFVAAGDLNGQFHVWTFPEFEKIAPKQYVEPIGLVWSMAFHPSEKMLATGSADNTVRIWDIDTDKYTILGRHDKPVHSVCFNSDGTILASSSEDHKIKLWYRDPQTKKYREHQTLAGHTNTVWSVAFSPDGKILASGSDDFTIKLWKENSDTHQYPDTHQWKNYYTFPENADNVRSVAFSPDGKLLASGSQDQKVILWNIETKTCEKVLEGHEDWIWSVAFNPDGKTLASCSDDQTIKIWDLKTKECCYTLTGHDHAVRSLAFSPDGKILLSGSYDQSVKLWEWDSENNRGQCIRTRSGISSAFRSIAFSPDSKILASGGADKMVRLWDLYAENDYEIEKKFKDKKHGTFIWSVAFSPDQNSKTLASSSDDKTVRLWNYEEGTFDELVKLPERTRTVAFSPDGNIIAVGSNDGIVRLWSRKRSRRANTEIWISWNEDLEHHQRWVWSVAFSRDSTMLASCSDDKTINLYDLEASEKQAQLRYTFVHESMVYSVAFSPDGKMLASGSADNTIKLWDIDTGIYFRTLEGHKDWVWSVAFTPDGKILASGSSDCTVKLWDVETGECLETLEEHEQWVRTIAISPDGKLLASAGDDQIIMLWNIEDINNVELWKWLEPEKPYEGMIITNTDLTIARKKALKLLGAIE